MPAGAMAGAKGVQLLRNDLVFVHRIIQRRATPDVARDILARALNRGGLIGGKDFFAEAAVQIEYNNFWVDILLPRHGIVVEIDGPEHLRPNIREKDRKRNDCFSRHGWRVIRFQKDRVLENPDECAQVVLEEVNAWGTC